MDDKLKNFLDKITVLPHDEYLKRLAEGGILVCMRKADSVPGVGFDDNIVGHCGICSAEIFYRPYNTVAINKVCIQCVLLLHQAEKGEAS